MNNLYDDASLLLLHIWRGIDSEFKSRYAREIWRIFEDAVRVSANQNGSLSKFASALCRRMSAEIGRNQKARQEVQVIINDGQDGGILNLYRTETPYIILLVRAAMQEIKEAAEEELQ